MLSRRILTISLLITAVAGYLYFFEHISGCIWLVGTGILIAMSTYIFHHQINWWWYRRYPPQLPQEMQSMYLRFGDFYKTLNPADRGKFGSRVRLFIESKEFIAQGEKEVAEDIKYIIAYYAVMVTFYRDEYLFDPYHRIVVYLHPFLSPHHPEHVHTYELEHEDGTVIFALEQLTAGFFSPRKYYQTVLHAFAELYVARYLLDEALAAGPEVVWTDLAAVGGWTRQQIEDFTGLSQADPRPVLIHHWFVYREKMQKTAPHLYKIVDEWLTFVR